MFGGFGLCGAPLNLINTIHKTDLNELTCISNNGGALTEGIIKLLEKGQVSKLQLSFLGFSTPGLDKQFKDGNLEVEFIPQGTLIEMIRCGGAGIPAFYTSTGMGTIIQKGGFLQRAG